MTATAPSVTVTVAVNPRVSSTTIEWILPASSIFQAYFLFLTTSIYFLPPGLVKTYDAHSPCGIKTGWQQMSLPSTCSFRFFGHRLMGSLSRLTSFVPPFLALFNDSVETSQMTTMSVSAQNNTFIKRNNSKRDGVRYRAHEDADRFLLSARVHILFSALHDYVKLIVLSGAFETFWRLYSASYKSLMDRFFITATFESNDVSFSEHSFPSPINHRTDPGFRMYDVLVVFYSSVPSVPRFFSQHQRSLRWGQFFGDWPGWQCGWSITTPDNTCLVPSVLHFELLDVV